MPIYKQTIQAKAFPVLHKSYYFHHVDAVVSTSYSCKKVPISWKTKSILVLHLWLQYCDSGWLTYLALQPAGGQVMGYPAGRGGVSVVRAAEEWFKQYCSAYRSRE
jgi:hypothetical protein